MNRRKLVAGNWKMHLATGTARALAASAAEATRGRPGTDVAVFPAFVHLAAVREALAGSAVALGAQACHDQPQGAHTGEVSAEMLADAGVSVVLCGHSERRAAGEGDAAVGARVRAVLRAGLRPLVCVGETLAERDAGSTSAVLVRQAESALAGLAAADLPRLDVAYEPVWAIGTGRTATAAQAVEAHAVVREVLVGKFGEAGRSPRILYGGSVKPSNAAELMGSEGVDGVLVGGASLDGPSFRAILEAAPAARTRPEIPMTFVLGLLAVIAVLASILLMFVILLQEPKGGGIASALGGSGMEAIGVHVGGVNRFTSWVAGIWIGACLLHAILQPVGADLTSAGAAPKTETPKETGAPTDGSGGGGGEKQDPPK